MRMISETTVIRILSLLSRVGRKLRIPMSGAMRLAGHCLTRDIAVAAAPIHLSEVDHDPDLASLEKELPAGKRFGSSICRNNISINPEFDLQIVVPVYNVENYVEECVDSIIAQQTNYKYLVVIVNDGSTDGSLQKLEKYEGRPNIEIISQQNKGLAGARNRGMQNIRARYVTFVDSDDRLLPGAIESLVNTAIKYDADVVEGGYKILHNGSILQGCTHEFWIGSEWNGRLTGYPWGKIFRAELFRDICFPEGYLFEDSLMSTVLYPLCKRMVTIADEVYLYRINPTGILSSLKKRNPRVIESLLVTIQLMEDNRARGMEPDQQAYDNFLSSDVTNDFHIINELGNPDVNHHAFAATCRLVLQYFDGFNTSNEKLKPLETALRTHDYRAYVVAVLTLRPC